MRYTLSLLGATLVCVAPGNLFADEQTMEPETSSKTPASLSGRRSESDELAEGTPATKAVPTSSSKLEAQSGQTKGPASIATADAQAGGAKGSATTDAQPRRAKRAAPVKIATDLPRVDITENSSLIYNFDNRNTQPDRLLSYADDRWGLWYNRLNAQASWKGLRLGLRVDTALFYTYPSPQDVGLRMLRSRPAGGTETDAEYFQTRTRAAGQQLINRYINWTYPSKYYAEYASRHIDVSVGDFYSQLGRGFVLSVRKMDELASDTTVRGGRLVARTGNIGGVSVDTTVLGGEMNPLRIDEPSGRYLGVTRRVAPGYLQATEAGMPYAITSNLVTSRIPTYAPDQVVAGQVLLGLPFIGDVIPSLKLGTQASLLLRQDALTSRGDATLSRDGQQILTASQSLEIPNIASRADVYLEVASQQLRSDTVTDRDGYAAYGAVGFRPKPFAITLEAKHYRKVAPLLANVDMQRATEFMTLQYSVLPNTLPIWADYEAGTYNVCTSGGRGKVDWTFHDGVTLYGWLGRYASWSEVSVNPYCDMATENRTQAWDAAVGMEIAWNEHRSHATWILGGRDDRADAVLPAALPADAPPGALARTTHTFYREGYLRYDVVVRLSEDYALQFQGWHRRRERPIVLAEAWYEGIHTTGLNLFSKFTTAAGFEYTTDPAFPPTYLNLLLQWRITSASVVSFFVGQRRGAIRCVGGVCRNYPPFEGARLDATIRW